MTYETTFLSELASLHQQQQTPSRFLTKLIQKEHLPA